MSPDGALPAAGIFEDPAIGGLAPRVTTARAGALSMKQSDPNHDQNQASELKEAYGVLLSQRFAGHRKPEPVRRHIDFSQR
jgi:hypothetical protein